MKIEKRGKYSGVKVHLEVKECEELLKVWAEPDTYETDNISLAFATQLGKKISKLIKEEPGLLLPRTDEEIQHELEVELESAQKKIAALKNGGDWKEVHVK